MKYFLGITLSVIVMLGIIAGGVYLFGNSITQRWEDEYASTKVLENCEVEGYDVRTGGRYTAARMTLLTSCGNFQTRTQEELYKMPIGEIYTLEVTTDRSYIKAAVNEKDIEER